ncbi:cysteine-rich repeat secretory protein 55-like [Lycium ferocissimum]|uniref:cysteine-rich repeat secretory protein 55-like n=1 Tax=Lycium ferocissimum TaxID=112874 RepID=UPI002814D781|nr:cysteine-rich repeat secretory protein 55-like [Lycium ferocissimum]
MTFLHYSFHLILLFCICSTAVSVDPLGNFCDDATKSNSAKTSANIGKLLAELVSVSAKYSFSTTSYGNAKNQLYGLYQCRGDISSNDCLSCIKDAAKEIRKRCPDQTDARIWYDFCFLRYQTKNFVGKVETSPGIFYWNVDFVSDTDFFNKKLEQLKNQITAEAIVPKNKGLGKGKSKLSPFLTLYALMQCTRDIPEIDCAQCLAVAVGNFPTICLNKKGCRILYSSCYVRYELYPFFFPLDPKEKLANVSMDNYTFKMIKP